MKQYRNFLACFLGVFLAGNLQAQSDPTEIEIIKKKRVEELRISIERDLAIISALTAASKGSDNNIHTKDVEHISGTASVLVARINTDGKWETGCFTDAAAVANFLAGNNLGVNLKALQEGK